MEWGPSWSGFSELLMWKAPEEAEATTNTLSKPDPVRYALGRIQLDTMQETYLPAMYDRTEARERFFLSYIRALAILRDEDGGRGSFVLIVLDPWVLCGNECDSDDENLPYHYWCYHNHRLALSSTYCQYCLFPIKFVTFARLQSSLLRWFWLWLWWFLLLW